MKEEKKLYKENGAREFCQEASRKKKRAGAGEVVTLQSPKER